MTSELLTNMRDIMINKNIEPTIAESVIHELGALWAGINVYFPKRHVEKNEKVHAAICLDYQNGMAITKLAAKYNVTQAWIYKIIKIRNTTNLQPQKL